MLKNSYKILFFNTMIFGTLISISSNSWFGVWMGLEINLLSFIPLMMTQKNLFSSEASLKYFLTQALASSILLFSILIFFMFLNFKMNYSFFFSLILSFTLLLKSGVAPFHFWFPSVMEGLNWMSNLIIMTWQKIAPLMILSYCLSFYLLILTILFSVIFGSLGGLNQTSLRKLLAFSSINHLGWMMAGLFYNENLWFLYFIFYIFLNFNIILMFNNFKLFNMNQIFNYLIFNFIWKFFIFCTLLSLGGLPPFLGFLPKWIIIEMMIYKNMMFILFIMVFCSLITLFFYLRISYSIFLMNYFSLNWNFKENFLNLNSKILNFLTFFSLFGMIFINFFYNFMNF